MLDKLLMFCEDQDLSQVANTYVSTDTFVLAEVASTLRERRGTPMEIVVQVTEAFTSAGGNGATLNVQLATGDSAALGNPVVQAQTGVMVHAQYSPVGTKFRFPIVNPMLDVNASHIGIQFVIATQTTNTGMCTAWIQPAGSDQDAAMP
jgi:hypothetical protein